MALDKKQLKLLPVIHPTNLQLHPDKHCLTNNAGDYDKDMHNTKCIFVKKELTMSLAELISHNSTCRFPPT